MYVYIYTERNKSFSSAGSTVSAACSQFPVLKPERGAVLAPPGRGVPAGKGGRWRGRQGSEPPGAPSGSGTSSRGCERLSLSSFSPAAGGAELEVVIPERVALEKIHLLPPAVRGDRSGPRRRRALPRQRATAEALLLRLPAAGAELYLHLRRDLRFLARGFVVEQRRGEAQRAPSPRRPPEELLCFYTGHVLNRTDSFASLSTCTGLVLPPRPAPLSAGTSPAVLPGLRRDPPQLPPAPLPRAARPPALCPVPSRGEAADGPGVSPQCSAPPVRCPACPLASSGPSPMSQ